MEAFSAVISRLKPVNGDRQLWLKFGSQQMFVGDFDASGKFPIRRSKLGVENVSWSRQIEIKPILDGFSYLRRLSETKNGGVFYLPSQPQNMPRGENVLVADDIALEIDPNRQNNYTRETQVTAITECIVISGLKPAFIIGSGGKSFHIHWKALDHLPVEQMVYLRRLASIALQGDWRMALPHQPMRIPGFYRKEKGTEQSLYYASDNRYSYEEIVEGFKKYYAAKNIPFPEELCDERWRIFNREYKNGGNEKAYPWLTKPKSDWYPKSQTKFYQTLTGYSGKSVPLIELVSKVHKEAILGGVGSDRNNTGVAVLRDLLGCAAEAARLGIAIDGNPEVLFYDYCRKCPPGGGWNEREWSQLWRGQQGRNFSPARKDLETTIHWWRYKNDEEYKREYNRRYKESQRDKKETPLKKILNFFSKSFKKKFKPKSASSSKARIYYFPKDELPDPSERKIKIIFDAGKRLELIVALFEKGYQIVLDVSDCGTGKSYTMAQLHSTKGGKTILATLEHRNPTNLGIENRFHDYTTRNSGLIYDPTRKTPSGRDFLRTTSEWWNADIPATCRNAPVFHKLAAKGYDTSEKTEDGKVNSICGNCKHFLTKTEGGVSQCAAKRGSGYGFLKATQEDWKYKDIIMSINSLPSPEHHNYSKDLVMVDEAGLEIEATKSQKVKLYQLDTILGRFRREYPDFFEQIADPIYRLTKYISGEATVPRYGLSHEAVIKILGEPPTNIADIIAAAEQATPKAHTFIQDDGIDKEVIKQLPRKERSLAYQAHKALKQQAEEITAENIDKAPPNVLINFLMIWNGSPGALRVRKDEVKVTHPDFRHGTAIKAAGNLYLADATADKDILALKIGLDSNSIVEIEQVKPGYSNLTVNVINLHGFGTNNPTHQTRARLELLQTALIAQVKLTANAMMSFKSIKWAMWFFADSRGQNRVAGIEKYLIAGIPRINKGAAEDEFRSITGGFDEEEFDNYYAKLNHAELKQSFLRQRSHLYPDRKFDLFYIVDTRKIDLSWLEDELPGVNVSFYDSSEFDPMTSAKGQRTRYKVERFIKRAIENKDFDITQSSIARELGVTQQAISKQVKTLSQSWLTLKHYIKQLKLFKQSDKRSCILVEKIINILEAWVTGKPIDFAISQAKAVASTALTGFKLFFLELSLDAQAFVLLEMLWEFLSEEEKQEFHEEFYPPPT